MSPQRRAEAKRPRACRTSASITSKWAGEMWLTAAFCHPAGPPPWEQKDGWMEWNWKVVYWSDVSLHSGPGSQDINNIVLEKVAEWPMKKGKRLVLIIYLVFAIHNPKFALVDCICNQISSQRRWIIHIFQSRNNGASPSATDLTSNSFDIDVSVEVHPCEKVPDPPRTNIGTISCHATHHGSASTIRASR